MSRATLQGLASSTGPSAHRTHGSSSDIGPVRCLSRWSGCRRGRAGCSRVAWCSTGGGRRWAILIDSPPRGSGFPRTRGHRPARPGSRSRRAGATTLKWLAGPIEAKAAQLPSTVTVLPVPSETRTSMPSKCIPGQAAHANGQAFVALVSAWWRPRAWGPWLCPFRRTPTTRRRRFRVRGCRPTTRPPACLSRAPTCGPARE